MTYEDKKLLETLEARLARNPDLVPQVLSVVGRSMKTWETRVQSRLDHHADLAISAALNMPSRVSDWKPKNPGHASFGRLVAVGWGLARREAGSAIERALVKFVNAADAWDEASAASHYRTIKSPPVPVSPETPKA